ncbi:O-antigen ligase family protein [Lacrimispora saccharolytica]|uniref:O-antigen ligase family protein n=1 Tax=Lacrimispora saccharolytica TaxID=84030 RepID=UPI00265D5A74|nr:O-antigen ligase family protein [Lacrimispora saccharolytica]MCF2657188.1 O-antigen ligase family protein [Lacrimispora saccharolytica]
MRLIIRRGNTKKYLLRLMMISLFFDAYCFTYVESFPITLFTVLSFVFILYSALRIQRIFRRSNTVQLLCGIMFFVILVFNILLTKNNEINQGNSYFSAFQAVYFVLIYLLSQRILAADEIEREINIFQKIVNISAAIGLIQIVLQVIGLSGDLWIPGHMVLGYNWTENGTGLIAAIGLHRAHAFFSEPSTYSQILGMNILLYLSKGLRKNLKIIILNGLAILASMSGTGILLIAVGIIYFLFASKNRKLHRTGWYSIVLALVVVACLYFFANSVYLIYVRRISEIFNGGNASAEMILQGWTTSSGFVRFVGVWKILVESLKEHFWIGCGIGAGEDFIKYLNYGIRYTLDNGFVRVAVETGVLGLTLYIGMIFGGFKIKNYQNSVLIIIVFVAMNFLNNTFSQNYFWGLMGYFNMINFEKCIEKDDIRHENTNY